MSLFRCSSESTGKDIFMDETVLALQKRLKAAGFDPGKLDGVMGPKTQAALNAEAISLGKPIGQGNENTKDWSDTDLAAIGSVFKVVGTTPRAMWPVIMYESKARPDAQNPRSGKATGLLQWMDFNLAKYGLTPEQFVKYSIAQQIPYVLKYLMPHKGKLINSTAVYMSLFQPAFIDHADEPNWTHPTWHKDYVYAKGTAPGKIVPGSGGSPGNVYNQNGFDTSGRGYIIVSDLTKKADEMYPYPRTQELINRTNALMGIVKTAGKGGLVAMAVGIGIAGAMITKKLLT